MKKLLNSLNEPEHLLVRETEKEQLADLSEDELLLLHTRVRRARNKYTKLYRQTAAAGVSDKGGRGAAKGVGKRHAGKAEVFEKALARVSRRLAIVARSSAEALKQERLALSRKHKGSPVTDGAGGVGGDLSDQTKNLAKGKSPGRKKREASSKGAGKRRQAAADSK